MAQPAQNSSKIAVLPPNTPTTCPPQPARPKVTPGSAPPRPVLARPKLSGPGRRTPPRLRTFFLRHFRACGEVKRAAERTGVAVSTLYRWRDRDEDFRERWDSLADQRRQMVEDRLMNLALEGERTAVFYKGEQVGWRVSHTARAAIALLAYFDRREKAARAEAAREEADQYDDDLLLEENAWAERVKGRHEERKRAPVLASRSEAAPEPKEASESDSSPVRAARKIGNGQALPAFDRDRVAVATPAPAPSAPTSPASRASQMPQAPQVADVPRLPNGQPWDDPATARRKTQELLDLHYPDRRPEMLPDNWRPYGL